MIVLFYQKVNLFSVYLKGDSLRGTIYIYAFEVTVALDDTLAGGIVGVWLVLPLTDTAAFVGGYESTYFKFSARSF
jgi:hypothetical protein